MEILFENKYTRTKDLVKKLYNYIYFIRKQSLILNLCMLIIIALYFVTYMFTRTHLYLWCNIIGAIFMFVKSFTYFLAVNNLVKRDAESNGGKPLEITIKVTEEYIEHATSSGSVGKLEYSSIKSISKHKDMIFIISKAKLVFMIYNDGFIKGTPDDFVKFVRSKIGK